MITSGERIYIKGKTEHAKRTRVLTAKDKKIFFERFENTD